MISIIVSCQMLGGLHSGVHHILCCVFVCLRPVSCVPYAVLSDVRGAQRIITAVINQIDVIHDKFAFSIFGILDWVPPISHIRRANQNVKYVFVHRK
jgi:hypothetical protein